MYKYPKRTTGIISLHYFSIAHYSLIKSVNDSSIFQDQQHVYFSHRGSKGSTIPGTQFALEYRSSLSITSWAQGTDTWPQVGLISDIALEVPSKDTCTWERNFSSRYLSGPVQTNPRCPRSWWGKASRLQETTSHVKSDIQQAKKREKGWKLMHPLFLPFLMCLFYLKQQWQNSTLG